MAISHILGFETGDSAEYAAAVGTVAVQSSIVRSGAYAGKATCTTSGSYFTVTGLALATCYLRMPFYIDVVQNPNPYVEPRACLVFNTAADANIVTLDLNHYANGTLGLRLFYFPGGVAVGSEVLVSPDTWYLLEARVTVSATVGVAEWKLNGVVQATGTNLNLGSTNIGTLWVGRAAGSENGQFDFYCDDVVISDSAYPGNGKIIARQGTAGTPNADAWTKTSSQTAAQVWSTTPFSATNEAHSTGASQAQTMLVAPFSATQSGHGSETILSGDTINACQVVAIAKEIGSGTSSTYSLRRRIDGADTDTVKALTASDARYVDPIWTTTPTLLDSAEIGGVRGADIYVVPTFVNAGAEGSAASGNITLGAPASPVTNYIWIAAIHSSDQVAHTLTDWTPLFQENGGGTTSRLSVWYFRYAGSTPNLIVGHTAGATIVGGIAQFSGCRTSGSPANVVGTGGSGTDDSIEHASINPSVANTLLLTINGSADDNNRSTLPTGFAAAFEDVAGGTQNCYQSTAGTPDGSVALHWKTHTTGATGELVDTQAAGDAWASVLIALEGIPSSKHMQIEDAWLMVDYLLVEVPTGPPAGSCGLLGVGR